MAKQKKTKSTRHHHIPRKAGSGRPGCDWNLEIRLVNDPQMEKRLRELMRILGIR